MDALDTAIVAAARSLPEGQLERIIRAIEGLSKPGPTTHAVLESAAVGPAARLHADTIAAAWQKRTDLSGNALALAIRTAVAATITEQAAETVEIAWTGPATPAVSVRRTESILLELIAESREELLVVSFAAYKVQEVLNALGDAADRGVRVWLVLESATESGGRLTFDAKVAFEALSGRVRFYSWPIDQRGAAERRGTLHAKAVIADSARALVTSANLTGQALELNMELGLLVEGGSVPQRLADHFRELIAKGILREVS